MPPSTSSTTGCAPTTSGSTTTTTDQTSTTPATGDQTGLNPTNAGVEETVTATGLHVVFTQPVSPSGVPAQFVEHILGEVYVDSLAVPAGPVPDLGFSSGSLPSSGSCLGGGKGSKLKSSGGSLSGGAGGSSAGGSSSGGGSGVLGATAGGATGSGGLAGSASTLGSSGSEPGSGSTGGSLPASFAAVLRKPLWLLLAYLVWQALVIGTGWSLWNWRRDGAS
jgi:hypothetical protein